VTRGDIKKIMAAFCGVILIFSGLSNIFLVKTGNNFVWGIIFILLGVVAIWYWRKK